MRTFWIGAAAIVAAVGSSAARADTVIDDFSAGPVSLTANSGQPGVSDVEGPLDVAHVAGGYRQVRYEVPGASVPAGRPSGTVDVQVDTVKNRFDYTVSTSTGSGNLSAVNLSLTYNGGTTTSTSAMDLNLAADGDNALAIDFLFAHFSTGNPGALDVTVTSLTGGVQHGIYAYKPVPESDSPFTMIVPLTAGSLDLAHISSIQIGTGNGNLPGPGGFEIADIRAVNAPEPHGLAGAALAATVTLAGGRRRRRLTD